MSGFGYDSTDWANANLSPEEYFDEYDGCPCPKCGHEMAYRECLGLGCEDGDYLEEDGINGDEWVLCDECRGTGIEEWCRECGWDNVFKRYLNGKKAA